MFLVEQGMCQLVSFMDKDFNLLKFKLNFEYEKKK